MAEQVRLTEAERREFERSRMTAYEDGTGGWLFRAATLDEQAVVIERIIAARVQAARAEDATRLADVERQGAVRALNEAADAIMVGCDDEYAEWSTAGVAGWLESRATTLLTAALGVTAPTASEAGVCTCGHSRAQHQRGCTANVGSTERRKTCACDRFESSHPAPAEASEVEGSGS